MINFSFFMKMILGILIHWLISNVIVVLDYAIICFGFLFYLTFESTTYALTVYRHFVWIPDTITYSQSKIIGLSNICEWILVKVSLAYLMHLLIKPAQSAHDARLFNRALLLRKLYLLSRTQPSLPHNLSSWRLLRACLCCPVCVINKSPLHWPSLTWHLVCLN